MIHLVDVTKQYGTRVLFEGLSWHVRPGSRTGLVGPNGAGKTTLLRLLTGEEHPDDGQVLKRKTCTVGYLPQEVTALDVTHTIFDEAMLAFSDLLAMEAELEELEHRMASVPPDSGEHQALAERYGELQARYADLGGFDKEAQARAVLGGLGFSKEAMARPLASLSGGWRKRAALARLLLRRPDVLLLDEPTNHLDLDSVAWLEEYLDAYEGALILVSHDRAFLNRLVGSIAELTGGRLVMYQGNYDAYRRKREERIRLEESARRNVERKMAETRRFIERFRAKATKARQAQARARRLKRMEAEAERAAAEALPREPRLTRFEFAPAPPSGKEVLTLKDVSFGYTRDRLIYEHLDLVLLRGERMAFVGPNGSGKTTLLKLLAGVLRPLAGQRLLGHNVKPGYFAQHQLEVLDPSHTVLESLESVAKGDTTQRLRGLLGAFGFSGDSVDKRVSVLSGGEKNRLALARLLVAPPNLLLMDEPTNHLDIRSREMLEQAMAKFEGTLVFISHDRYFIDRVADTILEILPGGEVTRYLGNYDDYLRKKRQEEALGDRGQPKAATPFQDEAPGTAKAAARTDPKELKRKRAELRNRRYRETRPVREELEALEARISGMEERLAEIEALQGAPETYGDPGLVQSLAMERKALERELEHAMARWEELGAALEEIEARFKALERELTEASP